MHVFSFLLVLVAMCFFVILGMSLEYKNPSAPIAKNITLFIFGLLFSISAITTENYTTKGEMVNIDTYKITDRCSLYVCEVLGVTLLPDKSKAVIISQYKGKIILVVNFPKNIPVPKNKFIYTNSELIEIEEK